MKLTKLKASSMEYINEYGEMVRVPLVGNKVPDFELEAYVGGETKKIKISDHVGKWLILLFYPADFTFICPTELEAAAMLYSRFQEEGAEILSVSTDTVFVH